MKLVTELLDLIKQNIDLIIAFTAIIAVLLAIISLWIQRRHNLKSLTPIANIVLSDYENRISVRIRNSGTGPLIITQFIAKDYEGQTAPNLIELIHDLPEKVYWDTYYVNMKDVSIIPSESLTLLKLSGDLDDSDFCKLRDSVRMRLADIDLTLEYKDIYGRKMPKVKKELKLFARHFSDLNEKEIPKKRA